MVTSTYVLLHILLLYVFYTCLLKFKKNHYSYWKYAIFPIAVFSLEEGLRWGRFIDWCAYYDIYYNRLNDSKFEFLFKEWWLLFNNWNIPYSIVITLCSLLFIIALFIFFKPHSKLFSLCFPILIAFMALSAENFIRWYVAYSVILISFRYFLNKKYLKSFFSAFLIPFLHIGIMPISILLFLISFWKKTINPLLIICISISLIIAFQSSFMLNFIDIVNLLFGNVEKFSGYMNNLEGWLTGTGQNAEIERKPAIIYILSMIPLYCTIYTAYKLRRTFSTELIIMYNLSTIGIILLSISSGLELIQRYAETFYPFIALMLAYIIRYLPTYKNMNIYSKCIIRSICYTFILYKFILFIRPLSDEAFMYYVWNYQLSPQNIYNLY